MKREARGHTDGAEVREKERERSLCQRRVSRLRGVRDRELYTFVVSMDAIRVSIYNHSRVGQACVRERSSMRSSVACKQVDSRCINAIRRGERVFVRYVSESCTVYYNCVTW